MTATAAGITATGMLESASPWQRCSAAILLPGCARGSQVLWCGRRHSPSPRAWRSPCCRRASPAAHSSAHAAAARPPRRPLTPAPPPGWCWCCSHTQAQSLSTLLPSRCHCWAFGAVAPAVRAGRHHRPKHPPAAGQGGLAPAQTAWHPAAYTAGVQQRSLPPSSHKLIHSHQVAACSSPASGVLTCCSAFAAFAAAALAGRALGPLPACMAGTRARCCGRPAPGSWLCSMQHRCRTIWGREWQSLQGQARASPWCRCSQSRVKAECQVAHGRSKRLGSCLTTGILDTQHDCNIRALTAATDGAPAMRLGGRGAAMQVTGRAVRDATRLCFRCWSGS
jgi:hypothetical protein